MYKVKVVSESSEFDRLVVLCWKDKKLSNEDIDLEKLRELKGVKSNFGEIESVDIELNNKLKKITFIGLGKKEEIDREEVRKLFGKVNKKLKEGEKITLLLEDYIENIEEILDGLILSEYKFRKYKSLEDSREKELTLVIKRKEQLEEKIKNHLNILEEVYRARDLINEPGNILYPETLGNIVESLGREYGIETKIYTEDEIEEIGMEAFLSVGKGSEKKPRLIVMRYMGNRDSEEKLGLVGKGLTYDSGGYSLKDTSSMLSMKADMGGAAVVIGTIVALAKNKIKKNVIGVIPACENLISDRSYKPGDIINSMAKKTIEIVNVDAEGRLTLVDGITYAIEKEEVNKVIDIATLTNTVKIALGDDVAAGITNNDRFYNSFQKAINDTDEKIWRMPNYKEYKKLFKSDIADLKNYGSPYGKVMFGGMFIGEFVKEVPWIHLDIAGPSFMDRETDYCIKGGTGFSLRTLYKFIKNYY